MSDPQQTFDAALKTQLAQFVGNVAGDGVTVECDDGVATIRGRVATATQARALADLVLGHEGVARVDSRLTIDAAAPSGARAAN